MGGVWGCTCTQLFLLPSHPLSTLGASGRFEPTKTSGPVAHRLAGWISGNQCQARMHSQCT